MYCTIVLHMPKIVSNTNILHSSSSSILHDHQEQVDAGVPLPTCLRLFNLWVRGIAEEREITLMEPGKEYSEQLSLCALGTWSGE